MLKLLIGMIILLTSCVQNMKNVNNLTELDSGSEMGYIAIDFNDKNGKKVKLKVRRESDGNWYSLIMNNPVTPQSSVRIFGQEVWSEKSGEEVTIPFNIVPFEVGTYVVRQAYTGKRNNTTYLETKEDTLVVNKGEVVYLGKFDGEIKAFLGIFPYGYDVKKESYDENAIKDVFREVPVTFSPISLD
ncbi:MAG: hypothetical protein OCD01_18875 [Fibrobacterales bacterium]